MLRKKTYKKGLVLSGGGARGIAHLGTARALYEAGHTFDVIIGTSMGAIVGCLLADKQNPEEIIKLFTPKNMAHFIHPTISKGGMMTLDGARSFLKNLLHVENIEDLSTPFIATATNLTTGRTEYIQSGNIVDAVIASSSIPVVFTPTIINGQQYIDGGVLNNLPARFIRDKCKKIFGSHVNPKSLGLHNGEIKGIVEIADRSFHLCIQGNVLPDVRLCDFYLEHTNLDKYSTFDFNKAKEIYQKGYENTKKALEANKI